MAGRKCFQYTALDDCTRYRVLRLYPRKYHGTRLEFLATVRQVFPFPIRKVEVDNGTEFPLAFALAVQGAGIRLRHIKPRRPEQSGKVERSHRIDEEEFWSRSSFDDLTAAAHAMRANGGRCLTSHYATMAVAIKGPTPST
ncbi:MAG: transposase family protein [Nitrospira sp.]|nr:transposase family protein [Nitrospira sp.]